MIPIVLFSTFGMGTMEFLDPFAEDEEDVPIPFDVENYDVISGPSEEFSGTLAEEESTTKTVRIDIGEGEYLEEGEFLKSLTFVLTWEDEGDEGTIITWENQPDRFSMSASLGANLTGSDSGENPHGGEGSITVPFSFEHETTESIAGSGEWTVTITLVSCGGFQNPRFTDASNEYNLVVTSEIYTPK